MKAKTGNSSIGFKRFICLLLVMLSVLTPVASVLPGADLGMVTTAEAANTVQVPKQTVYFKKYTGKKTSFIDALKEIGVDDSSYANRKYLASKNGISNYTGTAAQNSALLQLLKKGKLNAGWEISCPELVSGVSGREYRVKIQFRGSGISRAGAKTSNGDFLKLRIESDWKARYQWSTIYVTFKVTGKYPINAVNIIFYEDGNGSVMNAHREKKIPVIILGNG